MKKILTVGLSLLPMSVFAQGTGTAYFELPSDFQANAIATLTGIIGVILAIRVFPVMWKYLVQFFGKRGS